MSVSYVTEDNQLICTFGERMDTVNTLEIQDELLEKIGQHDGKVVFDMKAVTYIASSFLRLCSKTVRAVTLEQFSIVNVNPTVKKVFKIAGIADKLAIE